MAGRIPQHFIDDLLARTDIVDVIDSLVPLKRKVRIILHAVLFMMKKPRVSQ
jgi:DNA primase (bacterial type)